MTSKLWRLVWLAVVGVAMVVDGRSARAIETPNVLMAIDGMTINNLLFRSPGTDGYNTFVFNAPAIPPEVAPPTLGRYTSFFFVQNDPATNGGISHNARVHSDTPESYYQSPTAGYDQIPQVPLTASPIDIDSAWRPMIDRAAFGQQFDPEDYEIEVKWRPILAGEPGPIGGFVNQAYTFGVSLDLLGGFVWDQEASVYKRAGEQLGFQIGNQDDPDTPENEANPINSIYAAGVKDADGFLTTTFNVTEPTFVQRGFYYDFGNGDMRTLHTNANGGRALNEEQTWEDVTVGFGENYQMFGGGPSDPARPGSKIDTPNGVAVLAMGSAAGADNPDQARVLSLEIKHLVLKRKTPGQVIAQIDEHSSLTYRFGTGFGYGGPMGTSQPPINVDGVDYVPPFTDQISRFDENGQYDYLKFNMRAPDDPNEVHRFIVRTSPNANSFDGTEAVVNVRARFPSGLGAGIAQTLRIVAKKLTGNDMGPGDGADEWTYDLNLNDFCTANPNCGTEFTTLSVPLSDFTLSETVPYGFTNLGDGLLTDFKLYEFAGYLPGNSGRLVMDLDFMEIRIPPDVVPGDYNGDGRVDGGDYVRWRNHLGEANESNINNAGDGGDVGISDYAYWKARYGNPGSGAGGLTAVPEPSALALVGLALSIFGFGSRLRSNVTRKR